MVTQNLFIFLYTEFLFFCLFFAKWAANFNSLACIYPYGEQPGLWLAGVLIYLQACPDLLRHTHGY